MWVNAALLFTVMRKLVVKQFINESNQIGSCTLPALVDIIRDLHGPIVDQFQEDDGIKVCGVRG